MQLFITQSLVVSGELIFTNNLKILTRISVNLKLWKAKVSFCEPSKGPHLSSMNNATVYSSLWGSAREYVWQALWDKLLDNVGEDKFTLLYWGTFIVTSLVYWSVGLLYLYLDITLPQWVVQYKIQPGTNQPLNKAKLR